MQVQDYDEPIGDEIKLIVILAVSILLGADLGLVIGWRACR